MINLPEDDVKGGIHGSSFAAPMGPSGAPVSIDIRDSKSMR